MRCGAATPCIICGVAGGTDFAHTLLAITVRIAATAHTSAAVGQADRGLTITACVIRRVAELTDIVDAFFCAGAIVVAGTFDTVEAAISGHANGRIKPTAPAVGHITGSAIAAHTLAGIGIITIGIIATGYALIAIGTGHAIGRVSTAASVIAQLTILALT